MNKSGQALLLILLSMAAIITVVLSIMSRSVTDITISTREVESQRAFSAAEAGVERALIIGNTTQNLGNSSFTAAVSSYGQGQRSFVFPTDIANGEAATVWFVSHDANNDDALSCNGLPCFTGTSMKICWGKPGTSSSAANTPAIESSIFYANTPGDYSTVRVARDNMDPNTARRSTNAFTAIDGTGCNINGTNFQFHKTVQFNGATGLNIPAIVTSTANGLQFARLKMFYNDVVHPIGIEVTGGLLPAQGRKVESAGTSGQASRKVEVYNLFPDMPPIFDFAIFTSGGLTK